MNADTWTNQLDQNETTGKYYKTGRNFTTVALHDPCLQGIVFNEFENTLWKNGVSQLPWHTSIGEWTDTDMGQLTAYMESILGSYNDKKAFTAIDYAARQRPYHPVKDYLESLPAWDKVPRLDTLLVEYLGASDTKYVRAVTRKTLVAAVARVYQPGKKFDYVLTLVGPQGLGKSTLFSCLAGRWFSDSLTLKDMKDKTGPEKLQGSWIIELAELAGMRKTEVEEVKSFITATSDKYRPAYARNTVTIARQQVLVATTNAEDGFLRDVTGNRRFWPVHVAGGTSVGPTDLTPDVVAQVWAEALHYYVDGEPLYLSRCLEFVASEAQKQSMEHDDRQGMVETYLDTLLPDGWEDMDRVSRVQWLGKSPRDRAGVYLPGKHRRTTVSNMEIWAECFGNLPSEMKPQRDAPEIKKIMSQIDGWGARQGTARVGPYGKPYGKQRLYSRGEVEKVATT
ncbi:virulence-associated E family protein [Corynebacterium lubricantis]|uniref:virulence-associated E family protein n=1 Tax=Corynebacterium lubricantis TaxID=541095 RepID=UPI00036B7C2E|nr:virulence-associated E family protein [Corynebacterium lubricantis]